MELVLTNVPVQTERSFLKVYDFNDEELLKSCAEYIKNQNLRNIHNRFVGFFSDAEYKDYYYGSILIAHAQPLSQNMKMLLDKINNIFETDCNCILVNRYVDGSQIISKHRDSMNHASVGVIILSYGDTRIFRVHDNSNNKICDLPLVHNQLIQMGGDFQREFLHDIKREPDKGERISFSFHKYTGLGLYK